MSPGPRSSAQLAGAGRGGNRELRSQHVGSGLAFSVTREFARRCTVPCLVLPGNDEPHPAVTGAELAELLPNAEQLNPWKGPAHLDEQRERVVRFLAKHTP